ncbi:MAG TPA: hypothetical protein VKY26_05135 [Actinomycetota bacterium]|nr:hypothetical protein [Actinomycetota bacterium]
MDGFDAELYLRLIGEDLLAGGGSGGWGNRLTDAAKALLAVGTIDLATAKTICGDYGLALSLRGLGSPPGWQPGPGPSVAPVQPLVPAGPRIVGCERAIPQPWGLLTLHYAVLRADATLLKVTMARDPVQAGKRRGRSAPPAAAGGFSGWHPPSITLSDDRGTSTLASFTSGGGSDLEWEATYTARPGLAQDAGWIELLGERIVCTEHPAHGEVVVGPVAGDPATDFSGTRSSGARSGRAMRSTCRRWRRRSRRPAACRSGTRMPPRPRRSPMPSRAPRSRSLPEDPGRPPGRPARCRNPGGPC